MIALVLPACLVRDDLGDNGDQFGDDRDDQQQDFPPRILERQRAVLAGETTWGFDGIVEA